ncbi:MAG: hypothetical protein Tsb0015_07580 [Simkaniaceae bacterium]
MKKLFYLFTSVVIFCACQSKSLNYISRKEFSRIGKELGEKYEMNFLYSTLGGLVFSKNCLWALSLTSDKKMTLEEGEKLAAQLIKDLLEESKKTGVFKEYAQQSERHHFSSNLFGFRLAFWDENVDRPDAPYLSQIRFADDHVYFYYADPKTKALTEPVVKNLQEILSM